MRAFLYNKTQKAIAHAARTLQLFRFYYAYLKFFDF